MVTELAKQTVHPAFFIEMVLASSTLRVWTGFGDVSWDGHTWTGAGNAGSVSALPETTEVQAQGIRLMLSGIPSSYVTYALSEIVQGKSCKVWLAMLNDSGAVIADPFNSYAGRVDSVSMEEGGETSTLNVTVESRMIALKRNRQLLYTDADQQAMFPGDRGFEYVEQLQEAKLSWPGPATPIPYNPGYQEPRYDD
jgi:hypothetical protein